MTNIFTLYIRNLYFPKNVRHKNIYLFKYEVAKFRNAIFNTLRIYIKKKIMYVKDKVIQSFGWISKAWLLITAEPLDLSLPAAQEKLNAHDYWCHAFPESPTERWPDCLEQGTELLRHSLRFALNSKYQGGSRNGSSFM